MSDVELTTTVRSAYRKIALEVADAGVAGCCTPDEVSAVIGYTEAQLAPIAAEAHAVITNVNSRVSPHRTAGFR
jgi:hypothetical protein